MLDPVVVEVVEPSVVVVDPLVSFVVEEEVLVTSPEVEVEIVVPLLEDAAVDVVVKEDVVLVLRVVAFPVEEVLEEVEVAVVAEVAAVDTELEEELVEELVVVVEVVVVGIEHLHTCTSNCVGFFSSVTVYILELTDPRVAKQLIF